MFRTAPACFSPQILYKLGMPNLKNGRERKTRKSHIQHTPNYVIDQSIHISLDLAVLCCGIPITTNIFVLFNLQPHIIHIFTSLFLCVVIVFFSNKVLSPLFILVL